MSEHDRNTATIDRDLAAIEDALANGMAAHDDPSARELQELALALRADAPEPDPGFARELPPVLRRVPSSAGFAGGERRRAARALPTREAAEGAARPRRDRGDPRPARARRVAGGLTGDGHGQRRRLRWRGAVSSGDAGGGSVAPEASEDAGSGGGARAISPGPPPERFAPGQSERKIERSIGLELEAPVDELERVADQITSVTNRHGGFVLSSSLSTGDEGAGGDFELRIPSNACARRCATCRRSRPCARRASRAAT